MSVLFFPLCAFLNILIIFIIFFSKKKVNNKETKLFGLLLIVNLIIAIIEFGGFILYLLNVSDEFIKFLNRFYLPGYLAWVWILSLYIFYVSYKGNKYNSFFNLSLTINTIITGLLLTLPIKINKSADYLYTYGHAHNILYISTVIYVLIDMIFMFTKTDKMSYKKYYPLWIFILLSIITLSIRAIAPEIIITTLALTYVDTIMCFTIENPDIKMLKAIESNDKLLTKSVEDNSNLIFKISEDVKLPITKIQLLSSKLLKTDDKDTIYDYTQSIYDLSQQTLTTINALLDINNFNNYKSSDKEYELFSLLTEIVLIYKRKSGDSIDFKYNFDKTLPAFLKGDSLVIKQIISDIIDSAIDRSTVGTIDFSVSSITRNDISRLIIEISDNGKVLDQLDISNIIQNKETSGDSKIIEPLKEAKKLIDDLGGLLLIKSDDSSTVVTAIVNQLNVNKNDLSSYDENVLTNKETALVVCDDYQELENISDKLKSKNILVFASLYGMDFVTRINNQEHFDYIFIDDEMKPDSAVELLKRVDSHNHNTIIMLNKDKERIKDHYLEEYGFKDYLLKSSYISEIDRIIKKKKNNKTQN